MVSQKISKEQGGVWEVWEVWEATEATGATGAGGEIRVFTLYLILPKYLIAKN
jgi:hypothetical protein